MPRKNISPKHQIAVSLSRALRTQRVSQSELARRMRTSRAVVYRLLNANDPSLTITTLSRALAALGLTITLRLRKAA